MYIYTPRDDPWELGRLWTLVLLTALDPRIGVAHISDTLKVVEISRTYFGSFAIVKVGQHRINNAN